MGLSTLQRRIRTGILYSPSGGKKTSTLARLARYYHKKTGKKGRLISADGGGWAAFDDEGLIEEDIVDAFDISGAKNALSTVRKLSNGYWPRKLKNGDLYFASDERCLTTPEQFKNIGFYMVEGITSIARLWINHISNQAEHTGHARAMEFTEDGETYGQLGLSHYGLIQNELYNVYVMGFGQLPIDYLWTTALVDIGEDKDNGRKNAGVKYYGPKSAGSATTFEIPAWFGECWHLTDQTVKMKDKAGNESRITIPVAWFKNHKNLRTGIEYLSKVRILDKLIPEVNKKYPMGFVKLEYDKGLEQFYETYDGILKEYKEQRKKEN